MSLHATVLKHLGEERFLRFLDAYSVHARPASVHYLQRDIRRYGSLKAALASRHAVQGGSLWTELRIVQQAPRTYLITYGDHGPGYGDGGTWRVVFTAKGVVRSIGEQAFWIH